jgi:hypothetical protein
MKKLFTVVLFLVPVGVMAQTATANGSSSTSTTSAQGNNQAVTFVTSNPSVVTTNANINSTSTSNNTNNNITSGTSTNIVEYQGTYTLKNVPSVSGPPLTTSNDTCMGSTSASANGAGFGVSFGSTWTDEQCKRLKMSRELWNKGMKAASLAIDCMDPGARSALEMTGTKCPQSMTAEERRAAYGSQTSVFGAAPSPAPNPGSVTPVAVNSAPNSMQAPNALQAAAIVTAPLSALNSEPAAPVVNTESLSVQAPVVPSIVSTDLPVKNVLSRNMAGPADSAFGARAQKHLGGGYE